MLLAPEGPGSAGGSSSTGSSSIAGGPRSAPSDPAGRAHDRRASSSPALTLPQRPGLRGSRASLFDAPAPAPPPPAAAARQTEAPAAPPNPYRLAGTARFGERLMILLARGDALVEAKEGELLDDVYKVRSATPEAVALVYAPLGIEQLVEAMPNPGAAREQAPPPGSPPAPR